MSATTSKSSCRFHNSCLVPFLYIPCSTTGPYIFSLLFSSPTYSVFSYPCLSWAIFHFYTLQLVSPLLYMVLPKISEKFNIPCKLLVLRTCAARCLWLYLSTVSQPTGVFISARVSEFWLFSLHCFHVCLLLSKWRMLRSKEFALNFASSSTKLQLKPTEC